MANHMFVNQSTKCDRNIATNHKKLQERTKEMGELESVIEQRLIDQLCGGDSQWTYRKDIRTEEQLWDNFKYILEQNNKAKLNDTPLGESEFAKIKMMYRTLLFMMQANGRLVRTEKSMYMYKEAMRHCIWL